MLNLPIKIGQVKTCRFPDSGVGKLVRNPKVRKILCIKDAPEGSNLQHNPGLGFINLTKIITNKISYSLYRR